VSVAKTTPSLHANPTVVVPSRCFSWSSFNQIPQRNAAQKQQLEENLYSYINLADVKYAIGIKSYSLKMKAVMV